MDAMSNCGIIAVSLIVALGPNVIGVIELVQVAALAAPADRVTAASDPKNSFRMIIS
jgi:hypothetical protein